jgi:hypothetical protein
MKSSIFRDKTPCSPLKFSRRFGKTSESTICGYEEFYLPEYNTVQPVEIQPTFRKTSESSISRLLL